ncbi:MAG: hypothetical protein AAGJ70_05325, partial [Pseudomonadota bacterium]
MPQYRKSWRSMLAAVTAAALLTPIAAGAAFAKERFALIIDNKDYRHAGDVMFAKRDADAFERAL